MLKLGERIISDLYLGDKRIAKAFLGAKLVYKASEPIFLDYVVFDGASYIDTGIKYQTCTAEITVKYYEDNKRMLNGWSDQAGCYWGMYTDGRLELGNTYLNNTNLREKTTVNISLDTSTNTLTATINGESISRSGIGASRSYWIGATTSASSSKVVGEVYSTKFWNTGGELIQDLRPCLHPKTLKVCMYDMVSGKYFYNQGTGTLTAGNKINFVDYITFDGDSYIDTLFKPNPHTTRTVLDCMLLDNTSSGGQGVFGARPTSTSSINSMNIWFNTSDVPQKLRFDCTGDYQTLKTDVIDITQRLLIDCLDNSATVNGVTYSANVDKSNATYLNYSMYLGNFNNVGKPYTKGCKMNVYRFTIYDDSVLIQDLKPCVVNGVACFYDMVTGKLFTNIGTGTLKPSGRFVKSILFDGASVVDTGLKHQTCIIECDIRFEENGTRQLMGFGTGSGQYWGAGATGIFDYMSGTNALDRTLVVIDFNAELYNYTIYADGKSRTSASGNTLSSLTYRIGAGPTGVSSNSYWCTCEVWGNKFTNADGVLIQDLRPYVDEDGIPCFYDTVTNVKFYNEGTGTLSYTE